MSWWLSDWTFWNKKTLYLVQRRYYWSNRDQDLDASMNMREYVQDYCESCAICRRSKTSRHILYETLTSLLVSEYKWFDIIMNFVIDLSFNTNWIKISYDSILIVINRLTKMIDYILVTKNIIANQLINVLIREIIKFHDISKFIVTNRRFLFTSKFYSSLCYVLKIKKSYLLLFIFRSMIRRSVKTVLWSNICERMLTSRRTTEYHYCSWRSSL